MLDDPRQISPEVSTLSEEDRDDANLANVSFREFSDRFLKIGMH
jgi:hypothetical protein